MVVVRFTLDERAGRYCQRRGQDPSWMSAHISPPSDPSGDDQTGNDDTRRGETRRTDDDTAALPRRTLVRHIALETTCGGSTPPRPVQSVHGLFEQIPLLVRHGPRGRDDDVHSAFGDVGDTWRSRQREVEDRRVDGERLDSAGISAQVLCVLAHATLLDLQHSGGGLRAHVRLDLDGAFHWRSGIAVGQTAQDGLGIVRGPVRKRVGVDDVCWVEGGRGWGKRCGSCRSECPYESILELAKGGRHADGCQIRSSRGMTGRTRVGRTGCERSVCRKQAPVERGRFSRRHCGRR